MIFSGPVGTGSGTGWVDRYLLVCSIVSGTKRAWFFLHGEERNGVATIATDTLRLDLQRLTDTCWFAVSCPWLQWALFGIGSDASVLLKLQSVTCVWIWSG